MNLEYPQNPGGLVYKRMRLYTTKKSTIIMGYSKYEKEYKLLYISKQMGNDKSNINQDCGLKYIIEEDKQRFSSIEEAEQSIKKYQEAQKSLHFVCKFYGIVGFYKFLEGYYMLYIKEIKKIAKIGRHKLWTIQKTELLKLFDGKKSSKEEQQFRNQLSDYDMTQGFYSSYSYDLTNSLNRNMMRNALEIIDNSCKYQNQLHLDRRYSQSKQLGQYCEVFMWNYYPVQQFYQILENKKWVIPIIHGYLEQKNLKSLNSSFSITIISRRCRHHAGTRFCKRGLNQEGFAANYVETEQIVIDLESTHRRPSCSSFIQIRGSAPVFWYQNPSLIEVKPRIQITQECDPYYSATKKHFGDLYARYGEKIFCMDLVKSTQTQTYEEKLAQIYSQVVEEINNEIESNQQITYFHFDMKKQLKTDKIEYVDKSYTFAYYVVHQLGIFQVQDSKRSKLEQCVEIQNGVLRSNCVDCLDRTNSFQQLVGEIALAIQLAKIFQSSCKFSDLSVDEKVLTFYRGMYERMGDIISEQYGSSKAHKQNIKEQKTKWRFELFTSIQRHFKNNLSDSARQQSIDIFLGNFIPDQNQKIWQNPIKQFQPKSGLEIIVFKNYDDSQNSSRQNSLVGDQERSSNKSNKSRQNYAVSLPVRIEEKSWWKRSICFFKEETCVNLVRRIMDEEFKQSPEVFEKQYLPLFKTYKIPLQNERNKWLQKKFQIEFINIINKYDKSKLQLSTQSLKFVITLPKNYLFMNFQNTFQKISRKEISEKLSREYNKLIHLFPDQEFKNTSQDIYGNEKASITPQEKQEKPRNSGVGKDVYLMNQQKMSRNDLLNHSNQEIGSKKNLDQFDNIPEKQYTQIEEEEEIKLNDNEAINFSTMNRSEKVVNYKKLQNSQIDEEKEENFFRQDENSDIEDMQQENFSPTTDNLDNQEVVVTYLEPKFKSNDTRKEQANSTFFNLQSTQNGFQRLSYHNKISYQCSQEITLQEKFLLDDYFSPNIKKINEEDLQIKQSPERKRNNKQKNSSQQLYQSNNENKNEQMLKENNNIDDYFSYDRFTQKRVTDQSENYFDYKDIKLKQNISNEINNYFDNKLPASSNSNQKSKCPKCNSMEFKFDDNKMTSSYDNLRVRGHTTFFQKNETDLGEKGSSRILDNLCKHHQTEYMIHMSSYSNIHQGTLFNIAAQSQYRLNENAMSCIESEIGQSNISSDVPQKQRPSNDLESKKKNVQLLDMLVKRNFIFPQNTIINVV